MATVNLVLNLGSSLTGLSLSALLYTGATLAATVPLTETPVASGRYIGAFTTAAVSTSYDGSAQNGAGQEYGLFSFYVDASGASYTTPADVGTPTSPLWAYADFLSWVGIKTVSQASNKDSPATSAESSVNRYAVQMAFNYAINQIYDRCQGSRFNVPLDFTPNAGIVPQIVQRWGFIISMEDLTAGRGMSGGETPGKAGQGSPGAKWAKMANAAMQELGMYINGIGGRDLPCRQSGHGVGPAVVTELDVIRAQPGFAFIDGVPIWTPLSMGNC